MWRCAILTACALTALALAGGNGPVRRQPVSGPVVLNDNGAWSWFQDERAVVDARAGALLVSSVANGAGSGGSVRHGNVEVVAYDLESEETHRTLLHANLEADDHDSAALFVRPDGHYVAVYSRHNTDGLTRWRVSLGSGSATRWGPERTFDHGAGTTYSNLYSTPDVGDRLYNFVRSAGRDPHFVVSDDDGSTWRFGGRLLDGPGRPYVRYAIDGIGRIHLVTTEQHPHDFGNSVYHGVIDDGQLQRSDGVAVDTDLYNGLAADPTSLTKVFAGDHPPRAWTVDLQVDTAGLPYSAFSVRSPIGHRYHYARFDGVRWRVHLLGHAGRGLYADEPDYTGLVALDPRDPSRLVISTDAHPVTGRPLISGRDGRRHYELFEGVTIDDGATWSWTALTADSTVDNIRPIIPAGDAEHAAVLWLRGTYTSYKVYDLDVVGLFSSAQPDRLPGDISLAETFATMSRPRRRPACRPRRIRDGEYRRAHQTPGGPKFMYNRNQVVRSEVDSCNAPTTEPPTTSAATSGVTSTEPPTTTTTSAAVVAAEIGTGKGSRASIVGVAALAGATAVVRRRRHALNAH